MPYIARKSPLWDTLIAVLLVIIAPSAYASWPYDPVGNTPICTAEGLQEFPSTAPDGSGGAIIAWQDRRNERIEVYAQRVSGTGAALWEADGVLLSTLESVKLYPTAVSDGAGGAIVVWRDGAFNEVGIRAQRIDAGGSLLWGPQGIALCDAPGSRFLAAVAPDGEGGAIVAWEDRRQVASQLYAQRVSPSGVALWEEDGVPVQSALDAIIGGAKVVADGSGGAFVAWSDMRDYFEAVYIQRLDASGAPLWQRNGVPQNTRFESTGPPRLIGDDTGGVIVAWSREYDYTTHMQRVASDGRMQWTSQGVAAHAGNVKFWDLVTDGASGALLEWVTWEHDLYAQRVDAGGTPLWSPGGIPVSVNPANQYAPRATSDGAGGMIVAWSDGRNAFQYDIYAQRIDSQGYSRWQYDGIPVSTAPYRQIDVDLVEDEAGGAVLVWQDARGGEVDVSEDIYAQGLTAGGPLDGDSDGMFDGDDNCPGTANPSQANRDGDRLGDACDPCPDYPTPDVSDADGNGIGDQCECGDQTGDGTVNMLDLMAISRAIFGYIATSPLCDANNDGLCNVSDIIGANRKVFGYPAYCSRYPPPPVEP